MMQPSRTHYDVEDEDDEDDDTEYAPPAHGDEDSSDEEPDAKRVKTSSPDPAAAEEEAEKKRAAEALWQSFRAAPASPAPCSVLATIAPKAQTNTVKVEKRYRFAGEDVTEVVEVPEDSEDAKKWPRSAPAEGTSPSETSAPNHPRAASSSTSSYPASSSSIRTNSPQTSTPTGVPAKPARRPGPRRPKTTLAPLPGQQPKAKKLTVLDKSAMDWKSHVAVSGADSGLQDELAANRRGGGYLEKVDFLQRVEDRKEEAFEASKAGKRRRG